MGGAREERGGRWSEAHSLDLVSSFSFKRGGRPPPLSPARAPPTLHQPSTSTPPTQRGGVHSPRGRGRERARRPVVFLLFGHVRRPPLAPAPPARVANAAERQGDMRERERERGKGRARVFSLAPHSPTNSLPPSPPQPSSASPPSSRALPLALIAVAAVSLALASSSPPSFPTRRPTPTTAAAHWCATNTDAVRRHAVRHFAAAHDVLARGVEAMGGGGVGAVNATLRDR